MKKNRLSLLATAACALLLSACSTELATTDNPNYAGAGEAILSVSLQFPQADKPAGYAPGDVGDIVLPGIALDAEKEIKSIAFIVFTADAKGVFLSENPTLTPNGFLEPLTPDKDGVKGHYTAKFKIQSDDFSGKTTIVAIANYKEYNLAFDPDNLSITAIKAMLTQALEADQSLLCPLLMSVATEVDITDGSYPEIGFKMERLMARVDVVNNAFDKTTPANNFKLTSARLLSAASQGTMIGGQIIAAPTYVNTALETTIKTIDPAADAPEGTPSKEQLNPIYVYENSNKKADGTLSDVATAIEVNGTYQGQAYSKVIPFVTAQKVVGGVLEGGAVVSIERNTRYVVEISSSKEQELAFAVKVKDWDEGTDLEVEIDFKDPVLEGLEQIVFTNGATWDFATKTLNITKANAPSVFEFTVRGFQDSDFKVEKEYDENAAPLANVIDVNRGLLGMTGATRAGDATEGDEDKAPLVRTYKVTIPPYTEECPSLTKIVVYNAAADGSKTEITVKYAPLFTGGFIKNDEAISSDNDRIIIDLKGLSDGSTGTVSFFASSDSEVTITPSENKGYTPEFYTFETVDVTDEDLTYYPKYGPCKRVTVTYKAISDNPEFATISVKDASDATRKVLLSHFRKPITIMKLPSNNNVLAEGTHKLYLAVNNGDHGSITYTVFEKEGSVSTLSPKVTYATNSTSPAWANGSTTASETLSDFGVVKQTVTLALPTTIKNPAAVTAYTIGLADETPLELIPVYPSAYNTTNGTSGPITAADKAFRPVLVKTVWWAPINIGQTKISVVNDPSDVAGNLFQWGRKQALTWKSPQFPGPVDSAAAAGTNFITNSTSPNDWLKVQNNTLWNSGNAATPKTINDPCPAGWRVPSVAECNSVVGTQTWAPGGASASANGLLTVTGEAGTNLLFPAAGRLSNTGAVSGQGTYGFYWASAENGTSASCVYFNSATVSAFNYSRANGMPLRCVQDL